MMMMTKKKWGRGEVYFSKSEIRIISYTIAAEREWERESDNEWS